MLRSFSILMFAVLALTLAGISGAGVTVFQDPNNVGVAAPAVAITTVSPATTSLNLWYLGGSTASTGLSDPNDICRLGNGQEVCSWDIWVSTTSPGIILQSFTPDTGPGSDVVGAISLNVLRANGGKPTSGELGPHRIGTLLVTKQTAGSTGSVQVAGNLYVTTLLASANVTTGNFLATGAPDGDADTDGVLDSIDNCPTVPNGVAQVALVNVGNQTDTDGDGVGDGCDNCRTIANPRVYPNLAVSQAAYLAANPWATLSGGQRDDDHDGYGNKCDADFTTAGATVGPDDMTQFRTANGKARSSLTACGSPTGQRCARFDLDEAGVTIGPDDLTQYRTLSGKAKGPRCDTNCTGLTTGLLPCAAGSATTCSTP